MRASSSASSLLQHPLTGVAVLDPHANTVTLGSYSGTPSHQVSAYQPLVERLTPPQVVPDLSEPAGGSGCDCRVAGGPTGSLGRSLVTQLMLLMAAACDHRLRKTTTWSCRSRAAVDKRARA